jgi:hypothetical protein
VKRCWPFLINFLNKFCHAFLLVLDNQTRTEQSEADRSFFQSASAARLACCPAVYFNGQAGGRVGRSTRGRSVAQVLHRASEREREGREMTSWVSERSLIIESDEEEEQQQQRRRGGDDAGLGLDSDGSGSSSSSCTTPRRGPVTAASASASSYTHQWPQSYRYAPRVLPLFCLITPRFEFNFAATLTNG